MTRILVAISHHGLGHLAQAAPVMNVLATVRPDLEFLVWSGISHDRLAARIHAPFRHRHEAADVGLAMHDAVRVDLETSTAAYLNFHRGWPERVAREAGRLREERISGVLSDVACLPLAAAALAGVPSVALCSLNWVDIAGAYLAEQPGMDRVLAEMAAAYTSARAFLRVQPAMPMAWLENGVAVPPIAATGINRSAELKARLELPARQRLALIGFGGIAYRAARALPRQSGVSWLVPDDWGGERADMIPFSRGGLPFIDLVASCDALVTKVGDGSFVEGAVAGAPVLYIDRPDWPETPYLAEWLQGHARSAVIDEERLFSEGMGELLAQLWASAPKPAVSAPGAEFAARRVLELLG